MLNSLFCLLFNLSLILNEASCPAWECERGMAVTESWENEEFWSEEGIVLQGSSGGRVHCMCKTEGDYKK